MGLSGIAAIHSEYACLIFNGEKQYEFRRKKLRNEIEYLAIYETGSVGAVTGYAEVKGVIEESPITLWAKTHLSGGIEFNEFMKYFNGVKTAYAYQLGKIVRFDTVVELRELGIARAPQSLQYIDSTLLHQCASAHASIQ